MNYRIARVGLLRKYKPIYAPREKINIGSSVKLVFLLKDKDAEINAERIWVEVMKISDNGKSFAGKIDNDPQFVDLKYEDIIEFSVDNVFDIDNRRVNSS